MFGKESPEKLKDKIAKISQDMEIFLEELRSLKKKEKEIVANISKIAQDDQDFNEYYDDIEKIRKDEVTIVKVGNADNLSDPSLKDTAMSSLTDMDNKLEQEQIEFDTSETKVEALEEKDMEYEKELEKNTKRILEVEFKIRNLEQKSKDLTKKLENSLEGG